MAKISDKINSLNQQKLIKIYRNIEFYRAEMNGLEEKYQAIVDRKLNAFLRKGNKQLSKPAFKACDKNEYAETVIAYKLQKYDVKAYMKHRKIKHGAAKKIFAKMRKNEDYSEVLYEAYRKLVTLRANRNEFIWDLECDKQEFVEKNRIGSAEIYLAKKEKLEQEYYSYKIRVEQKYNQKLISDTKRLQNKIDAAEIKSAEIKAKLPKAHQLPDDVLLEVKGLKMYFGGLKAVDDLTFNVKKGEIFGLIGPNGAGKTTVFNCITRFYDATGGDMHFENKYGEVVDLRNFKVHDIILQGIGRTFQNIELVKEISVLENLLVASTRSYRTGFFGHMIGLPSLKKEDKMLRAKAMKILEFMDLDRYAAWYAMGLPYGILKKVEIARALMADAKLIIMDEPAAGLNDTETAELTETIRKIRDEFGVTILLVEHDMSLVMNVCDTVCAISFGQMLGIGTTEEIQQNVAVQEAYLGVAEEE